MRTRIELALLSLFGLSALVAMARADEEKVPLDKVPAAVMKAVKAKFPKGEIKGAEKEVEDGKTTYEITLVDGGHNVDVSLKDDGTILEAEKEIAAKDLPKAVADGLKAKYPKATIKKAEEITEGSAIKYEVIVTDEGQKPHEVVLDKDGKILKDEVSDED